MIYCYRHPDGHVVERIYPIGKAPQEIVEGDIPCPRDFGAENKVFADAACAADSKYPYVSRRLPKNLEGCQTDKYGNSVVMSKSHEANIASKYNMRRE